MLALRLEINGFSSLDGFISKPSAVLEVETKLTVWVGPFIDYLELYRPKI